MTEHPSMVGKLKARSRLLCHDTRYDTFGPQEDPSMPCAKQYGYNLLNHMLA